jgi:hypothetical protein
MTTIYLAGAINGCTDEECKDWREYVKDKWPGKCLDPMDRDYRGREDECFAEIIAGDEEDIAACDVVLVSADKPSWGTAMEIRLASKEMGKPLIVVCPPDMPISPWLRGHSTAIVHSYRDGLRLALWLCTDGRSAASS